MLILEDVHAGYGQITALRGVSLRVDPGEIVCLIGANGAGKSTCLMVVSGVVRASQGDVTFLGQRISAERFHNHPERIVKLGICQVPEGRRIFPELTVLENLEMGSYHRRDREGVREDLERVLNLFPVLRQRQRQLGGTMSGGEQQMLAIGRALMTRPRLLLLDEPSLGLAPKLVTEILHIVRRIHAEGTAVLLVEQNAMAALHLASRGYVLERGRVALEGSSEELLRNEDVRRRYLGEG